MSQTKRISKQKKTKPAKKGIKAGKQQKKTASSRFFDMEADEGEDSDELQDLIDRKLSKKQVGAETYSKEFLQPKVSRLNPKMLDDMMKKYDEEDDVVEAKGLKEEDVDMEDDQMQDEISKEITLPSIKDSKLWRVQVTPGRERELVFKITNKLIEYLNQGNPLNVLEVFECQLSQGVIYCEAFKIQHVEKVLQGLSGVNLRNIKMIPINEMTEVMKSCQI